MNVKDLEIKDIAIYRNLFAYILLEENSKTYIEYIYNATKKYETNGANFKNRKFSSVLSDLHEINTEIKKSIKGSLKNLSSDFWLAINKKSELITESILKEIIYAIDDYFLMNDSNKSLDYIINLGIDKVRIIHPRAYSLGSSSYLDIAYVVRNEDENDNIDHIFAGNNS